MNDDDRSALNSLVVFTMNGEGFAMPVGTVREVVPIAKLSRSPQLPTVVEGILNLRGAAVPVLRLDRLLGVEDCDHGIDASILIMRGTESLGLLVQHVSGVRTAGDFQLLPVNEAQSFNGCLSGELVSAGTTIHLLSWDRLLVEEERARLSEFQTRAQARLTESLEGTP